MPCKKKCEERCEVYQSLLKELDDAREECGHPHALKMYEENLRNCCLNCKEDIKRGVDNKRNYKKNSENNGKIPE